MQIDIEKLRRFHADAHAAHAALMRQTETVRDARAALSAAREHERQVREPVEGVRIAAGPHGFDGGSAAPEPQRRNRDMSKADRDRIESGHADRAAKALNEAVKTVKAAARAVEIAEAELARLDEVWQHAARLRTRVRDFAIENGVLPDDLKDQ